MRPVPPSAAASAAAPAADADAAALPMADADFAATDRAIRQALAAQGFMRHVGAEVVSLAPGRAVLALARRAEVLQQHGYFHGGAIAFLVDNTTTVAAGTLIDRARQGCLTAEYKLSLLSPGTGEQLVCEAEVVKPGRQLSTVAARVFNVAADGTRKLCAIALATIAVVESRPLVAA